MTARLTQATAAAALVAGALASTPAASHAQTAGDGRWRAFAGCWEPISPDGIGAADPKGLRVCVLPSAGPSAVDIVNVTNGKVAERTHVEATGQSHPIGREGCTGVESAQWSADSLRVFLKAELTCDGVHRTTSGILAIAPSGDWVDVQGVTTGRNSGVHVARYRPVADLAGYPAEVTTALPRTQLATSLSRGAASGPLSGADVLDAVKHVDAPVVEAWLLDRGQGFQLDAKQLAQLADAGVPGSVTDLMVALSFPKQFAIRQGARDAEMVRSGAGTRADENTVVSGRTIPVTVDPYGYYSPFGWGAYSPYYSWYGYRYGGALGAYGNPYGYGGYGYGYGGPIVIVRSGDAQAPASSHPQVVRGRGYTEGRTPTPSAPSASSSPSSSGSSSGSSSTGSSSSGSSSSGGERTAHPRP